MVDEQPQEVSVPQKSSMNPLLIGGVVVIALLLGAGMLFMGQSSAPVPTPSDGDLRGLMTASPASGSTTAVEANGQVITVEGGVFYFKPNEIRVKVGQLVTVKLDSVASDMSMSGKKMKHDFVIDELNVKSEEVEEGVSTTFTFTPTEKGEYEFYCSVGEHRANGMVGTLIVE